MRKILIVNPYYYPGFRSGGPQQTFMNIVEAWGDVYEFYILTLNHDLGSEKKYDSIIEGWNKVGKCKVRYLFNREFTDEMVAETAYGMDIVYAGGLFEKTTRITLKAKRKNLFHAQLWVAPMGVFSDGAFKQKRLKKELFLKYAQFTGLFKKVNWSFTSELELADMKKHIKEPIDYEIAQDIPKKVNGQSIHLKKEFGKLKIIFLSRICPKKNLQFAIKVVEQLKGKIIFDIYGTKEDKGYWDKCEEELNCLPENIIWSYKGEVESSKVVEIFSGYDIFLFPTLGENFGHVIYESLAAGCIPIISDRTPWGDIALSKCGEVISLDNMKGFVNVVMKYVEMSNDSMEDYVLRSIQFAQNYYDNSVENNGYTRIFSG